MSNTLFEKIYGWLVGAASGDAIGAPVENMHYLDIREQFGRVETFLENVPRYFGGRSTYEVSSRYWHPRKKIPWKEPHPFGQWQLKPGVYTDDMRYRLLVCKSFIKYGRRITGWEFAQDIMDYVISCGKYPHDDPRYRWASGMFNLDEIVTMCLRNPFGSTLLVGGIWGSPAGIINACDPQVAAQDGGVMGAVIAQAMHPEATVDSVIKAAFDFAQSLPGRRYDTIPSPGDVFSERLERALKTAEESSDVFELTEKLYQWILMMFPPWNLNNSLEVVPVALAMIYKAKGDVQEAVIGGANFGRDCDTIAALTGEVCGALNGISNVPPEWVSVIKKMNPDPNLEAIARQLVDILISEAKRTQQISGDILSSASSKSSGTKSN